MALLFFIVLVASYKGGYWYYNFQKHLPDLPEDDELELSRPRYWSLLIWVPGLTLAWLTGWNFLVLFFFCDLSFTVGFVNGYNDAEEDES